MVLVALLSLFSQRSAIKLKQVRGKSPKQEYLKKLGATLIVFREEVFDGKIRALGKQKWRIAVNPVGGDPLASLLSQIQYGGSVAVSGLTAGTKFPTSVFPFILRGGNLLRIDSVYCPNGYSIEGRGTFSDRF